MTVTVRRWVSLFALLIVAGVASAQEAPTPPWMSPDVLKAAIEIGMTDDQTDKFRVTVGKFLEERGAAINKLIGGHNVTNLDRKVKSRTNALAKDMDEEMATFLSPEQMPRYEVYRDTLISKLWQP